ncbi:MAG: zf-HC2 domain-containing protein [Gemmataceae bacterium]|nr:zf-HC2 domain-containing protein [Gemmataceae bacterium]
MSPPLRKPEPPKVEFETFAAIVEGRYSCLTLEDFLHLIGFELQANMTPSREDALREHLAHCPRCQERQKALLRLRGARREA